MKGNPKRYIKEVRRYLSLDRAQKDEIERDLREMFAAAEEHGESFDELSERLGSPREYAARVCEQFGKKPKKRMLPLAAAIAALAAAVAAAAVCIVAAVLRERDKSVIGYADGMTAIELKPSEFDPTALILITAAIAAAAAVAVICAHIRRKKETMRR